MPIGRQHCGGGREGARGARRPQTRHTKPVPRHVGACARCGGAVRSCAVGLRPAPGLSATRAQRERAAHSLTRDCTAPHRAHVAARPAHTPAAPLASRGVAVPRRAVRRRHPRERAGKSKSLRNNSALFTARKIWDPKAARCAAEAGHASGVSASARAAHGRVNPILGNRGKVLYCRLW